MPRRFVSTLSLAAGILAAAGPARAICYSQSCGVCAPPPGFAIATLIPATEFPAATNDPIAFVDPGDERGRRLVATQQGAILVWDAVAADMLATPFLDLSAGGLDRVLFDGNERGLLGMAADPDYAATGHLYVFYTRNGTATEDGDVVVERYTRSAGNPDVADTTATSILVLDHPASNHNGGWLAFGPDGFLYVTTGDGGGGCDGGLGASGDGQRTNSLHGKMLRLDVRNVDPDAVAPDDCALAAGAYEVPSTNPFVGSEPACDEVWIFGLRNPFRFSFDRATGDLYIGDVGQDNWEEINLKRAATPAPVNFGWVCREGCSTSDTGASSCAVTDCPADAGATCQFPTATSLWDPLYCHSNPLGWSSAMGGYRYRGARVPAMAARYVYSDNGCGQLWLSDTLDPAAPATATASCWKDVGSGVYSFAEDRLGEIYLARGFNGRVECVHAGDGCYWARWRGMFEDDFENAAHDFSRWSDAVGN